MLFPTKKEATQLIYSSIFDTSAASVEVLKVLVFSSVKHLSAEGSLMESCSPCSPDIDVKPDSQQLLDHSATSV